MVERCDQGKRFGKDPPRRGTIDQIGVRPDAREGPADREPVRKTAGCPVHVRPGGKQDDGGFRELLQKRRGADNGRFKFVRKEDVVLQNEGDGVSPLDHPSQTTQMAERASDLAGRQGMLTKMTEQNAGIGNVRFQRFRGKEASVDGFDDFGAQRRTRRKTFQDPAAPFSRILEIDDKRGNGHGRYLLHFATIRS